MSTRKFQKNLKSCDFVDTAQATTLFTYFACTRCPKRNRNGIEIKRKINRKALTTKAKNMKNFWTNSKLNK